MKKRTQKSILRALYHYLLFFMLVALTVSITMSIFVSTFSKDLGLVLTDENLNRAAKLTFLCVMALSLVITLIDVLRRRLTTERITKRVANATREVVGGNFGVRIAKAGEFGTDSNYNEIIDCFNKMAEELGGLETLRTDFVADVSHEMKTPLAVMKNYGTLLQTPDLSDEKRIEYAKGVTDGAQKLADMMTNILKLNRLENQQIYPSAESFDLGEQLCECLLRYEAVWERKNIEITTDIEEDITVRADRELLSLIWNNLLSNAFKFTESGGEVSVSLKATDDFATVTVGDTGCGMTAEVGDRIFEKFYQGDTSRATQGNGLGLALVKRVADIIKAEISVESTPGVGTVFCVKIRRNQYGTAF